MSMAFLSPSPMELMVIAVIALIVLGPSRLPEAARSIGKGMREMRDSFQGGGDDEGGGSDRRRPDDPPDEPGDDGVDGDASFDELGDEEIDGPEREEGRERVGAGERSS